MIMRKIFSVMFMALALVACGGNKSNGGHTPQELSGAGATFPLPFYNVVFEQFAGKNGDAVACNPDGVEELMKELQKEVTILIVTHNMGRAMCISSKSMFMYLGELIEYGPTATLLN